LINKVVSIVLHFHRTLAHATVLWEGEGSTTTLFFSHCHLAKFRDLMYRVKYGAVIG